MRFSFKKIVAAAVSLSLVFGQTAWADTVSTAASPSEEETEAAVSFSGNFISATGPSGGAVRSGDVVVISGGSNASNLLTQGGAAGPGASTEAVYEEEESGDDTLSGTAVTVEDFSSLYIAIDDSVEVPELLSASAILVDALTGQVLYEKDADTRRAPASTTKLLTAILVMENLELDDTITFTSEAVNGLESGATTAAMSVGDTMTVEDALHALLMKSACDVAVALAIEVSGSEEKFAELMNEKAEALGCTNSTFKNASGLNDDEHLTTARDLAIITKAALADETIREITQKYSYTLPATSSRSELAITNTNHFVKGGSDPLDGYLGGKTGYTTKALQCLATSAEVGGRELVAVVLKAQSPSQYDDSRALYEYGEKLLGADSESGDDDDDDDDDEESSSSVTGTWELTDDGSMMYKNADGEYLKSEWLDLGENTYFFDSDGIMCTGWVKFSNGSWYYFNTENGAMVHGKWVTQGGKSYYLQDDGTMAVNTVINDTYRVDENGVYVEKVG